MSFWTGNRIKIGPIFVNFIVNHSTHELLCTLELTTSGKKVSFVNPNGRRSKRRDTRRNTRIYKSLSTRFGSRSMERPRVQEPMAAGLHNFLDIRLVYSTWHPMVMKITTDSGHQRPIRSSSFVEDRYQGWLIGWPDRVQGQLTV